MNAETAKLWIAFVKAEQHAQICREDWLTAQKDALEAHEAYLAAARARLDSYTEESPTMSLDPDWPGPPPQRLTDPDIDG